MITRVQIKNFRSIAEADVTLGPLTVLVGRNGAGKSNFVDALRFVRDALKFGLEGAVAERNGIASLRRWSSHGRPHDIQITLFCETGYFSSKYGFTLGGSSTGNYVVKHEFCNNTTTIRGEELFALHKNMSAGLEVRSGRIISAPLDIKLRDVRDPITKIKTENSVDSTVLALQPLQGLNISLHEIYRNLVEPDFYSIYPNTLSLIQPVFYNSQLGENGENLPGALGQIIKGSYYPDFLAALRCVVEDVNDIRVRNISGYSVAELSHSWMSPLGNGYSTLKKSKNPWFPLNQESDGTLRVIGLLTALYVNRPSEVEFERELGALIGIEEPELNLYPKALTPIAEVLREASNRRQVLITSQSPDLISHFKADEIRVVESVNGQTTIGPLADYQRRAIIDEIFSGGDLLRIEGLHSETSEAAA